MRTELAARGFDYLTDARKDLFINDAYHEICQFMPWPFLRVATTTNAPATLTDIDHVLSVYDATNKRMLRSADNRDLETSVAGTPTYWYLDGDVLRVEPTQVTSLTIRYIKVPVDLTAGTDSPIVPSRFRSLIVDIAQIAVLSEDADNAELAMPLAQRLDTKLIRMGDSLMNRQYDSPDLIIGTTQDF